MTDTDLTTRAREIAAGLDESTRRKIRIAATYEFLRAPIRVGRHWLTQTWSKATRTKPRIYVFSPIGRAVAAVLAEGGV